MLTNYNQPFFRIALALITLLAALTGCAVNPVTGERTLNFMSEDWERSTGAELYAPMRQSQGGDFILDPELTEYVSTVGERLAAQATRPLAYEFRVLNDSTPNAWALPGGKIVVNRGLLTEIDSEAQLAAVLAHEIVHADAAHGARAQSKGIVTQVGAVAGMIYLGGKADSSAGRQVAQIVPALGAQLITQKYGRDAEREADLYGMQYMSAAGYDPRGAVELQRTFVRLSENRRSDWLSGLFASHPPSRERLGNNEATAARLPPGGESGQEVYRAKTAYLARLQPAYEAHDQGRKALAEEQLDKAGQLSREALEIEPREALFHSLAGDIHMQADRYVAARDAFNDAVQRDSGFFYHFLRRGQAHYALENHAEARRDLERSLDMLPTAEAHYLLGNLDMMAGDRNSAVGHFETAAKSQTQTGRSAQIELVRLEPLQFLRSGRGLDRKGNAYGIVKNEAPVTITISEIQVVYLDSAGRRQELARRLDTPVAAGEQVSIALGLGGYASQGELEQRLQFTVTGAAAADD